MRTFFLNSNWFLTEWQNRLRKKRICMKRLILYLTRKIFYIITVSKYTHFLLEYSVHNRGSPFSSKPSSCLHHSFIFASYSGFSLFDQNEWCWYLPKSCAQMLIGIIIEIFNKIVRDNVKSHLIILIAFCVHFLLALIFSQEQELLHYCLIDYIYSNK